MQHNFDKSEIQNIFDSVGVDWCEYSGNYSRDSLVTHLILTRNKISSGESALDMCVSGLESFGIQNLSPDAYSAYNFLVAQKFTRLQSHNVIPGFESAIQNNFDQELLGDAIFESTQAYQTVSGEKAVEDIMRLNSVAMELKLCLEMAYKEILIMSTSKNIDSLMTWLPDVGAAIKHLDDSKTTTSYVYKSRVLN